MEKDPKNGVLKRPGWTYLVRSNGKVKIGCTVDLKGRLKDYKMHNPDIEVIGTFETEDPMATERKALDYFSNKRVEGEWFNFTDSEIAELSERMSSLEWTKWSTQQETKPSGQHKTELSTPIKELRESVEENHLRDSEERSRPRGPETGSARPQRPPKRKEPFEPEGWKDLGALKDFLHEQDSVTDFPLPYFGDDRWWREIAKQVNGIQTDQVRRTFAFMANHFLENPARRPVTKRGWLQKVRNLLVKQVEMDNQVKRRNGDGLDPHSLKERLLKKLEETT
jgi:hypothetical protein